MVRSEKSVSKEQETKPIHRAVLSRLSRKRDRQHGLDLLKKKLDNLKRRRIFLTSEIKRHETKELCSRSVEELMGIHGQKIPPYVPSIKTPSFQKETVQHAVLAMQMRSIRTKRRIVGAHCLSGISLVPNNSDDSAFGVRLDNCVEGQYRAGHAAFFRIIKSDSGKHVLRLVQHTLPTSVVSRSDVSVNLLDQELSNSKLTEVLRGWVGGLFDSCHSYVHRKSSCEWLSLAAGGSSSARSIDHVKFNDNYDTVSFHMVLRSRDLDDRGAAPRFKVCLVYARQLSAQPSNVDVYSIRLSEHVTDENTGTKRGSEQDTNCPIIEVREKAHDNRTPLAGIERTFKLSPLPNAVDYAWQELERCLSRL